MNKFSIVTPSLNQSQFLEQTIKSVLGQAGDFYIEYIIADGGSTDESVEIIKKYDGLLKDNQYMFKCMGVEFKWWSKKDKGQADAINQGLAAAKGDVLTWINSDDYYENNILSAIADEFNKNRDLRFVYGDANLVGIKNEIIRNEKLRYFGYNTLLKEGNLIHQPASFFSRKLFNKFGPLDSNLYYTFDYDLILKSLKNSQYKHIDKTLANFRIWSKSKTYNKPIKMMNEMEKVRRRYGGKFFNPSNIHRLRHRIPGNKYIKKKFPKLFKVAKNTVYKSARIKSDI